MGRVIIVKRSIKISIMAREELHNFNISPYASLYYQDYLNTSGIIHYLLLIIYHYLLPIICPYLRPYLLGPVHCYRPRPCLLY